MFSNVSIKIKLLFLTGILSLGLMVVGGLGSYTLTRVSKYYEHIASVSFVDYRELSEMRYNATLMAIDSLGLLIPGNTAEDIARIKKATESEIEKFSKAEKTYLEIPFVEGEEEIFRAADSAWKVFHATVLKFISLQSSKNPQDIAKSQEFISKELPKLRGALIEALDKALAFQTDDVEAWIKKAQDAAHSGELFSWILNIACFLSSIIFGLLLSKSLDGTLRDIANRLAGGADEVASSSQQVSASSEELSSAASKQASSLQQTSASIEEISAMIAKNAENAAQSQKVSLSSQGAAEKGKEAVSNMLKSMDEINSSNAEIMQQMEESNRNISDIVKVIAEIGNKTKVINDIVFQTKLLSFNASVEAARAGEHGKGFAVVAEEVGNLAQMSGTAAKEISAMLDGSIRKVEDIVKDTRNKVERLVQMGKEKVNAGTETAQQCSTRLEEMAQSIDHVSRLVAEIATASQEQSTGVGQINRAIGQLDQATQQNASASQLTASASEKLSSQADGLRSMVRELMRIIDGGANEMNSLALSESPKNGFQVES